MTEHFKDLVMRLFDALQPEWGCVDEPSVLGLELSEGSSPRPPWLVLLGKEATAPAEPSAPGPRTVVEERPWGGRVLRTGPHPLEGRPKPPERRSLIGAQITLVAGIPRGIWRKGGEPIVPSLLAASGLRVYRTADDRMEVIGSPAVIVDAWQEVVQTVHTNEMAEALDECRRGLAVLGLDEEPGLYLVCSRRDES